MKKRGLGILLISILLLNLLPLSVWAADGGAVTAQVTITAQGYGGFFFSPESKETISSDLAESYGYQDKTGTVTALDALVRAHELTFGEDFTEETAEAYLAVSDAGYISTVFGVETGYVGFTVNDLVPGSETVITAALQDGDDLNVFLYQDSWSMDNYTFFSQDGKYGDAFQVKPGEDLTLAVNGYSVGWYGYQYSNLAEVQENCQPLEGVTVGTVSESGEVTPFDDLTDENGEITLSFDTEGTYYITADASETDDSDVPVIMNLAKVVVSEESQDEPSDDDNKPEEPKTDPDDSEEEPVIPVTEAKDVLEDTLTQMAKDIPAPEYGNEWNILAMARDDFSGVDADYYKTYYDSVVENVKSDALSNQRSTDNSRVILALTAIGKNPTDVGGYNLLAPYEDFDWITKQGITGPVYALLALDSGDYETKDPDLRQKLVDAILEQELEEGGWTFYGDEPDVDLTSMALQALAPYADDAEVSAAAKRGFALLKDLQNDDNTFTSWGETSSESLSQYIVALAAWNQDPSKEVKALLTFYSPEDAAFKHTLAGEKNFIATQQASYALVSYERYLSKANRLYDMTDVSRDYTKAKDSGADGKNESTKPDTNKGNAPNTGDDAPILFLVGMGIVALAGVGVAARKHSA